MGFVQFVKFCLFVFERMSPPLKSTKGQRGQTGLLFRGGRPSSSSGGGGGGGSGKLVK